MTYALLRPSVYVQVTCRFDSNQDPDEYSVVYREYKYYNEEEKKICNHIKRVFQ
jgi:hypothetical protein